MTAAAQRTPVSLLFSFCVQNGLTADYDLTAVEGASHDPTFTYRCKVNDVEATASGHSKKKAKHSAAKMVLEQLLAKPEILEKGFNFEDVVVTAKSLDDIILEPVGEKPSLGCEAKNAIGILQEHCVKEKISPPYYETIHESGPPHDKTFVVQCMVGMYITEGEGKTKRICKRIAAELMLAKLPEKESSKENKQEDTSKTETDTTDSELVNDVSLSDVILSENEVITLPENQSSSLEGKVNGGATEQILIDLESASIKSPDIEVKLLSQDQCLNSDSKIDVGD